MISKKTTKVKTAPTAIAHVAFLRGINMIGHKLIPMTALVRLFSSLGLQKVKTYLATGNVVFESEESDPKKLTSKIEKKLKSSLGYEVIVMLRSMSELELLVSRNPFDGEEVDNKKTKAVVTFLATSSHPKIRFPFLSPKREFKILGTGPSEVFSLRYALGNGRFGDSVSFIEREFGAPTTSRNYNTVIKILALK